MEDVEVKIKQARVLISAVEEKRSVLRKSCVAYENRHTFVERSLNVCIYSSPGSFGGR